LAAAQIKATLTDDRGNILPNVTVTEKQSGFTTVTNPQGQFTIDVETGMKEVALIFKREGYHPKEKTVPIDDGELTIKVYLIPQDYDLQKITVTAMNRGKRAIDVPMAEHSISTSEIRERMSENVVETIADTTGVSFIGSGGLHVTPTIRGLARRRVLILVDGHRVTSDRRAGTSPAFIQPELAGSVEVVRTGASVLYGSDAIGGVINILTRTEGKITRPAYERNSVNLIYNSSNNRVGTGITYGLSPGKWNIYAGFQYSNAGDYESPEDTVYHSGFKYYSGLFDLAYSDEKKEFYLGYIGGVGNDIGKPDRANERFDFTYVPVESHHYLRMGYKQKDIFKNSSLNLSLFFNPSLYRLDKVSTDDDKIERAETRAFNLGIKASLDRKISESLFYQFGVEWFSRQNVKTENAILNLGENVQSSFFPMDNGSRNDISAFLSFDYRGIESFELNGGVRYTFFSIDAVADGTNQDKNSGAASFFLAATKRFSDSVALFVNVSRAFRFPALSESFYTGLTGRRFVIGNPDLDSESSINVDLGLKVSTRKIFMGVYLFTDHIKKMIERYRVSGDIYTFDNINQGRILGSELELRYQPSPGLDFFGHFFYYHGKSTGSDSDDPLNDIPAPRILLGGKYFIDRLWVELSWLYSFKKDDPGPSEEANDAFNVADIKAGYYFSSAFFIDLKVGNVFNTKYFPNSDPDIPLAKGINVSAGVHYYF
jgi:outer membrane receptor protein involved in Fe transport